MRSQSTVAREPTVVTLGPRSHPKMVAAMNPCCTASGACWRLCSEEVSTTAMGTLLIRLVPNAAPPAPTRTAPKLVPPERRIPGTNHDANQCEDLDQRDKQSPGHNWDRKEK